MSAVFLAKTKVSKLLPINISISVSLAEDVEENGKNNDDENVQLILSSVLVVQRDNESFLFFSDFQIMNEEISCNKEWDKRADTE